MPGSTVLAQRNPTLLFRFSGEFLLRLGARAFDGLLLFHDAPRKERFPKAPCFVLGSSSSDGFPQKPQRTYLVRTARVQPPSIFPISRLWVEKYSRWESESRRSRCAIRTSTRARVSARDAAASSATLSRT